MLFEDLSKYIVEGNNNAADQFTKDALDNGIDPVSIFFDVTLEKAIKQKVGNFYMRSYLTKINREIPDSSAKGTRPHPDYIQGNNCKIY